MSLDVPTEGSVPVESEPDPNIPKRGRKKEVTYARPVFATELLTEDGKKRFDNLPAWQRQLVKRLVDHGDLKRAAVEAGVGTHLKDVVDLERGEQKTAVEALNHGGLTPDVLVAHIQDCLDASILKSDKHGNLIPTKDLSLKLRTLELVFKLRGDLDGQKVVASSPKNAEDLFPED